MEFKIEKREGFTKIQKSDKKVGKYKDIILKENDLKFRIESDGIISSIRVIFAFDSKRDTRGKTCFASRKRREERRKVC